MTVVFIVKMFAAEENEEKTRFCSVVSKYL